MFEDQREEHRQRANSPGEHQEAQQKTAWPPGDLPDPGTEPASLMSSVLGSRFFTTSTTWEALPALGYPKFTGAS